MTESELLIKDFRIMYDLSDEDANTLSHFNADQLKEIFAGLLCGAEEPVKFIMNFNAETFDANQIAEIIDGGKKGLNYREYVNPCYNYLQMKLIKDGMLAKINYSAYANPNLTWEQMFQIKKGLEEGLNVLLFNNPNLSLMEMIKIRRSLLEAV